MDTNQEAVATRIVEQIIEELFKGRKLEEIRQKLISSGLNQSSVDAFVAVAACAGKAAIEVKQGKSFNQAVDGMDVPSQLRPLAEKILKAVYERVKDRPDSVAGNPCGIDLESAAFLKAHLAILLVLGVPLLLVTGACTLIGRYLWEPAYFLALCAAVFFVFVLNKLWTVTKTKFKYGNVCPGVVTSLEPFKIAVLGNLAHGGGPACNVVKVVGKSINRPLNEIKVDERVAMVAVYKDGGLDLRWEDFYPEPVYAGTSNQEAIRRVIGSIPEEHWNELNIGITQIPDKTESGLYQIALPCSDAANRS